MGAFARGGADAGDGNGGAGGWRDVVTFAANMSDELIQGRDWETWKPLLCIAKHLDTSFSGLFDRIRSFALEITIQKKQALTEESFAGKLLTVLRAYFMKGTQQRRFISLKDLLDHLRTCHSDMVNDPRSGSLNPWVTTRWLGNELRKSGVVTGAAIQHRVGEDNVRGYEMDYTKIKERMRVHGLNPDESI